MMWYGRRPFPLSDDAKTVAAILLVRQLESSGEIKRWEKIDRVLTQVVGKTDDWSPADYGKIVERVFGARKLALADIVKDTSALARFKDAITKDPSSARIVDMSTGTGVSANDRLKSVVGFRFLGMRFTWDAYLFSQLTAPNVPRSLPTAADAMALFGSTAADEVIHGAVDVQPWKGVYYRQQTMLKQMIGKGVEKKETTYDSWVSAFSTLFLSGGSKQVFTRSRGWQYKNLNAALGSWTELKHDTILYSKQSGAEAAEGPEFEVPPYDPPSIKGYVEPNPLFFASMAELASGLSKDLQALGFLTDEYKDKLQSFDALSRQAQEIAKKEVEGHRLSETDYGWIRSASHKFNRGLLLPRSLGDIVDPDLLKMALIADIATDYLSGSVLEVAVGVPQRIRIAVKDLSGGTRMTTGFVYSWYEFSDTKRWQDSEWRSLVYGSEQERLRKMRPTWYSTFQKPD